jgi:hypothetical protein
VHRLVAAGLAAIALAATGCRDDAVAVTRPSDFTIWFTWRESTVAPQYHYEWTVTAGPTTSARISYVPSYPGPGVPHFIRTFTVSTTALNSLYTRLQTGGLLRTTWPKVATHPIGGPTTTAAIRAGGKRYRVPAFSVNGSAPLAPFVTQVRALVPAAVWRDLQARRAAYVRQHFGP